MGGMLFGEVAKLDDPIEQLTARCQLLDEMHPVLVLVDLNQSNAARMVYGLHDADLVLEGFRIEAWVVTAQRLHSDLQRGARPTVPDPANRKRASDRVARVSTATNTESASARVVYCPRLLDS